MSDPTQNRPSKTEAEASPEGCNLNPDQKSQLRTAGAHDGKHAQTVQKALDAGFDFQEVLGWITQYGPMVLDLVQKILDRRRT